MIWARVYLIEDFDIFIFLFYLSCLSVSPQNMKNCTQLSRKPVPPPCRSQEKVELLTSRRRQKHFIMLSWLFKATCLALLQNQKQSRPIISNGKLPYGAITNMVKAGSEGLLTLADKKESRLVVMKGRCQLVLAWVYYQEILRQICAHFIIQV